MGAGCADFGNIVFGLLNGEPAAFDLVSDDRLVDYWYVHLFLLWQEAQQSAGGTTRRKFPASGCNVHGAEIAASEKHGHFNAGLPSAIRQPQ